MIYQNNIQNNKIKNYLTDTRPVKTNKDKYKSGQKVPKFWVFRPMWYI